MIVTITCSLLCALIGCFFGTYWATPQPVAQTSDVEIEDLLIREAARVITERRAKADQYAKMLKEFEQLPISDGKAK